MNKLMKFFSQNAYANIIGCVLSCIGVGMKIFSIINNYWIFIVLSMYVIGFIIGKIIFSTKELEDMQVEDEEEKFKDLDAKIIDLKRTISNNKKYFDTEAIQKIEILCSKSKTLLDLMQKNKTIIKSEDIRLSEKIILEYLPSLLKEYFEIPVDYVAVKKSDQKSALDLFKENIDTITIHVDKNLHSLIDENTKDLVVQSKFLKSKIEEKQHFEAIL